MHACTYCKPANAVRTNKLIEHRFTVATKASPVARSLKLRTVVSTWMGDRQGRPSAVNLCPFVGVDLNL